MAREKIGDAYVRVTAEVRDFQQGMSAVQKRFRAVAGTLGRIAKRAGIAIAIGLAAGIALGVREASRAEEIGSKFDAVFKHVTDSTRKWAREFSESVGRNRFDVEEWLSTFQDTFVPLGFARRKAAEFSKTLAKLTVDLASFNDKAEPEVLRDLQSALVGNHETVRKYGVIISEATLKQEILNSGMAKTTGEITAQMKVRARLQLIIKGTTDAQGDAIRTAGSTANQFRALTSSVREAGAEFGMMITQNESFSKILTAVIAKVRAFSKRLAELREERFFDRIIMQLRLLWSRIKEVSFSVIEITTSMGEILREVWQFTWDSIVVIVKNSITIVLVFYKFLFDWVSSRTKHHANIITTIYSSLWRAVPSIHRNAFKWIISATASLFQTTIKLYTRANKWILSTTGTVLTALTDVYKKYFGWLAEKTGTALTKVMGLYGRYFGWLREKVAAVTGIVQDKLDLEPPDLKSLADRYKETLEALPEFAGKTMADLKAELDAIGAKSRQERERIRAEFKAARKREENAGKASLESLEKADSGLAATVVANEEKKQRARKKSGSVFVQVTDIIRQAQEAVLGVSEGAAGVVPRAGARPPGDVKKEQMVKSTTDKAAKQREVMIGLLRDIKGGAGAAAPVFG